MSGDVYKFRAALVAGLWVSGLPNGEGKTEADIAGQRNAILKQEIEEALGRQNAAMPVPQSSTPKQTPPYRQQAKLPF